MNSNFKEPQVPVSVPFSGNPSNVAVLEDRQPFRQWWGQLCSQVADLRRQQRRREIENGPRLLVRAEMP